MEKLKKLLQSPQAVFYGALAIGFILVIYFVSNRLGVEQIRAIVRQAGVFGPFIFIILSSLTYIIAPLSGGPFFVAGFALFGKVFIIYAYIAAGIGVIINFWISRIWGRRLVTSLVGKENMDKIDQFTKNYGLKSLIFLRVFQGYLSDFISYAYGLTNMKFLPYLIVSALAPIPWLLIWFLVLFPRIATFNDFLIFFGLSLVPIYLVSLAVIIKYKLGRRQSDGWVSIEIPPVEK